MDRATENHWTPPTMWCPVPQHWHSDPTDADTTEFEVTELVLAFVRALQPEIVVETGTATGATAVAIGTALKQNGHGRLYTVELDIEAAKRACDAVDGLPVDVIVGDSLEWDPPTPIDFAWIDCGSGHVRTEVLRTWAGKFRSGAVVGVHDTAPTMGREVLRNLLNAAAGEHGWPILNLRTPRGVSFLQVP